MRTSKKNNGILIIAMTVVGGVIITFLYNYILLNQREFVIVGNFVLPYVAANDDKTHPFVYTFTKPISKEWILNIQNTLSYALRPDAKVVIKIQEAAASERFIEILMYGDAASNRFSAAVNTNGARYIILYDKNGVDGWSGTQPIIIAYDSNQHLSISVGAKALVDRLPFNSFTLGSIAVYGKDDASSPLNAYAGHISFETLWGRPSYSPIFYLPLAMQVGVGGLVAVLLVFKKKEENFITAE